MISPDWLTTDPIPSRAKGWVRRGPTQVSLKTAFMSPEGVGAGQEGPPARDDWRLGGAVAPPPSAPAAGSGGFENEAPGSPPAPISPPEPAAPSTHTRSWPSIQPPSPPDHWRASVSPSGEVGPHDHSAEHPDTINQIPPAGAQLSGDGTWLSQAETQLGRGYVWGGKDPRSGFDCSGYASWVLQQQGRPAIGSSTMTMYPNTVAVSDPQPGDLVFYNMNTSDPHMQHVAVYIGNGQVIQSGGTKESINIASANQPVGSPPEFRRPKGASPLGAPTSQPGPSQTPQTQPVYAGQQAASSPQPSQPQQPAIPQGANVQNWFSYVDSGQEVMKIVWDNGQETYHTMGPASSHADTPGTVLDTGGLGAGADVDDAGGGGDNQTEWIIPTAPQTGLAPTTTPAPPPPTRDDWSRSPLQPGGTLSPQTTPGDSQTEWPVPAPGSASTTQAPAVGSAAGQSTKSTTPDQQTEWSIPDVSQLAQTALQTVSGTIGGAANAVAQKAGELVTGPGGPAPSGAPPAPANAQAPAQAQGFTFPELPDITPSLQAPPEDTPLGQVVQAGVQGQAASPATQLAAVPQLAWQQTEATNQAATNLNPARDVPVLGGLIEQSASPEAWFPIEKLAGPAAGLARKVAPEVVEHLWDPLTHTFQQSWERLMPDAVTSAVPATAASRYAADLGVGTAAGVASYAAEDPSDPNRLPKAVAAGLGGTLGAHVAIDVTPAVVKALKETFDPVLNVKAPGAQEAVRARGNRIEAARGENWMWRNRIEETLGKPGKGYNTLDFVQYVEEHGAAPPGANADVQQLVDDMVTYVNDTGDEGRRLKYIFGDITTRPDSRGVTLKAYMPRVLQDHLTQAGQTPGVWAGRLNPRDSYSHMREHVSIADGRAAGIEYANSASEAFGHYAEHVNASRANALFIKDLKRAAPDTIQRIPRIPGTNSRAVGSIPKGWTPGSKYMKLQWQNVAFAPELNTVLRNITEPGIQNPVARGVMSLQASAKQALFAPSVFHLTNEIRQIYNAAGREGFSILPKTAQFIIPGAGASASRKFWANPSVMDAARDAMNDGLVLMRRMPEIGPTGADAAKNKAMQAGWGAVTGGSAGYVNARFDSTMTEEDRIKRGLEAAGIGAAGGLAGGYLSHQLWSDVVPYMKLMTYSTLKPQYGGKAAAEFSNEVYGGQNLESIARSRKVQDVLRMLVLAPDWQEGWIRQVGNGILGMAASVPKSPVKMTPIREMNRNYWARAAVTSAFMLEGFNLALSGHPSWQNGPGHETSLETTGLMDRMGAKHEDAQTGEKYRTYVDLLGVYRSMLNAPANPGSFLSAREGLFPQEAATAITGKDWRGKDIAPPGTDPVTSVGLKAAYLLSRLAPVGPAELIRTTSQPTDEPLALQAGQAVLGLRETRYSPLQEKVKERDRILQSAGITATQEQDANTVYTGLIKQAENKTLAVFDPAKTPAQIVQDVRNVSWPNRQSVYQTLEPPQWALDPVKNADFIAKMQQIGPIGTQSSQASADLDISQLPVDSLVSAYWSPPGKSADDMGKLPPDAQDRLREAALVQKALAVGQDPNAARDAIKAQARDEPLVPLPGVSSATLDEWVAQWRSITDPDPQVQAEARRAKMDEIAQNYNVSPQAVYQRIKLRSLPITHEDPNEPEIPPQEKQKREMQVSYERATDLLYGSKDPTTHPKYAGPDGSPYKGSTPQQWAAFDQQIAADTKAGKRTHSPEVQALIDARNQGQALRLQKMMADPAWNDYVHYYGTGRNMDQTHWQQYMTGEGHQYTDIFDSNENRRRARTLELWKASTPQQRRTTRVKVNVVVDGKVREEVDTLDNVKKHIERNVDPVWKTNLLDTTGAIP